MSAYQDPVTGGRNATWPHQERPIRGRKNGVLERWKAGEERANQGVGLPSPLQLPGVLVISYNPEYVLIEIE